MQSKSFNKSKLYFVKEKRKQFSLDTEKKRKNLMTLFTETHLNKKQYKIRLFVTVSRTVYNKKKLEEDKNVLN